MQVSIHDMEMMLLLLLLLLLLQMYWLQWYCREDAAGVLYTVWDALQEMVECGEFSGLHS